MGVETLVAGLGDKRRKRAESAVEYVAASASIQTVVISFFVNTYLLDTHFAPSQVGPSSVTMSSERWSGNDKADLMFRGLDATVKTLRRAGKIVVLAVDVPELPFSPKDCLGRPGSSLFAHECRSPRNAVSERESLMRALLARVSAENSGVGVYDPTRLFCDDQSCRFESTDAVLYRDVHHLTAGGSEYVARDLLRWLDARPTPRASPA